MNEREAKYERNIKVLMDLIPEHEREKLPVREKGETARKYARRLRIHTYQNARFTQTWQQLQKEKSKQP